MNLLVAVYGLKALINKYCPEYSIKIINSPSTGGYCDYENRVIALSKRVIEDATVEQTMEICLHEISHALCEGHGHDKVWRDTFIAIGGSGRTGHTVKCSNPKHSIICSNCRHKRIRHRIPKKQKQEYKNKQRYCGKCGGLLLWFQHY